MVQHLFDIAKIATMKKVCKAKRLYFGREFPIIA